MTPPKIAEKWPRQHYVTAPVFGEGAGARLQTVRQKLHLTQAELGERLGISQAVVSDLEIGRTKWVQFTLAQLFDAIDTHANFVLYGTSPEKYPAAQIREAYFKKIWEHSVADREANRRKRKAEYQAKVDEKIAKALKNPIVRESDS